MNGKQNVLYSRLEQKLQYSISVHKWICVSLQQIKCLPLKQHKEQTYTEIVATEAEQTNISLHSGRCFNSLVFPQKWDVNRHKCSRVYETGDMTMTNYNRS